MKKRIKQFSILTTGILSVALFLTSVSIAQDVNRMSLEQLNRSLDDESVIILDVRAGKDWSSSEYKIKGALRADPKKFDQWATLYPEEKTLVLYCA